MKIRTFATATTTLLGAALISYGQGQQQDRAPASGSPAAEEQTSQPGDSPAAGQQNASPAAGAQGNRPSTPSSGANASQAQGQEQARAGSKTDKDVDWEEADKSEMPLSAIPDQAKNAITTISSDGEVADQVTRLSKDDKQVFKATVNRENEEELHIFVKEDGTMMKTKQKIELSSAPQSVRSTIDSKLGADSSVENREVYRVMADNETTYVVGKSGEKDKSKMLHIDSAGTEIEKGKYGKTSADRNATEQNRSASPSTVTPGSGTTTDQNRD